MNDHHDMREWRRQITGRRLALLALGLAFWGSLAMRAIGGAHLQTLKIDNTSSSPQTVRVVDYQGQQIGMYRLDPGHTYSLAAAADSTFDLIDPLTCAVRDTAANPSSLGGDTSALQIDSNVPAWSETDQAGAADPPAPLQPVAIPCASYHWLVPTATPFR